jgi:hypothetical protein
MDFDKLFARPLALGRELATRKIITQFAHKYGLVYLGGVNQHEAQDELIRGITVGANHIDSHFCVGSYAGHDVSLVERRNTILYPERPPQKYRWLLMQFDLRVDNLPHAFIDGNHHDELFYETLFMKFANFTYASSLFVESDPLFAKTFRVFTPADRFDETEEMLTRDITAMLTHHFKQFDYEISGDRLLIYAGNPVVSLHMLQEMLRVGRWLAAHLDKTRITTP